MRAFLALAAVLLLIPPALGAERPSSDPVEVTALAVAEDASGTFIGVHATVRAQVVAQGSGQVYVATKPLAQTDMQGSARLASRVAAATLGIDWASFDYLVSFESDSTVIGGPSAGAVMAIALTVALHNLRVPSDPWSLDAGVAGTGTINADGTIGPVGGIPAKAQGAKAAGLHTFLYPAGLDVATTQVNGRTVAVDMRDHCADLGLTCRPVATLAEFLAAAAGVGLVQADVPVPSTGDYAAILGPSVQAEIDALAGRVAALDADGLGGLPISEQQRIRAEGNQSRDHLAKARRAQDDGAYYLAATESFQGAMAAGRAENLTAFQRAGRAEAVVTAALGRCADAVAQAEGLAFPLEATSVNALYAVASAQERAVQARSLLEQATALHADATRFEDWVQSLFASTFCVERAATVAWWADLRDAFGPGPAIDDLPGMAREAMDEANEAVAYAAAVLGEESAAEATQHLADALAHQQAGRPAAAILAAVEAQTAGGVAMQAGAGGGVPNEVLEAARQSAARAIAAARNGGIEPMLSISLVELAGSQVDTALALESLWTARTLALLEPVAATPQFRSAPDNGGVAWDAPAWILAVAAGGGALAGAAVALAAVAAVRRR